ncbi:DUF2274 domain-containing protein [Labrys sp. 22185]|uniref:DUF2274 domain-containing protein n=1 Tax=Labrys sp. 22185 TaxID=3453888 RepID=UPI003F87E1AE
MAKLKLGALIDEKPIKVSIEIPATLYRDLVRYAELLGRQQGTTVSDPVRLIVPMLDRFMKTDRGFVRGAREEP